MTSNLKIIVLLAWVFSFATINISAQHAENFNQFYLLDGYFNSSLLGNENNDWKLFAVHRQWATTDFNGNPKTQILGLEKKVGKVGFGGHFFHDQQGQAFTTNSVRIASSIDFKISTNSKIGFGGSITYNQNFFNPNGFQNMESGDPLVDGGSLNENFLVPTFSFNYLLDIPHKFSLQVGFSSTNLHDFFNPQKKTPINSIMDKYNGLIRCRIGDNQANNIEFISLLNGNGGFGNNYIGWSNSSSPNALNSILFFNANKNTIKPKIGLGINYFTNENLVLKSKAFSSVFSIAPMNELRVGLAYNLFLNNLQNYTNGSFEISLLKTFEGKERPTKELEDEKIENNDFEEDISDDFLLEIYQYSKYDTITNSDEAFALKSYMNSGLNRQCGCEKFIKLKIKDQIYFDHEIIVKSAYSEFKPTVCSLSEKSGSSGSVALVKEFIVCNFVDDDYEIQVTARKSKFSNKRVTIYKNILTTNR